MANKLSSGNTLEWIVDDATDLATVVINESELGKLAFKKDDSTLWMAKGFGSGAVNWVLHGSKYRDGLAAVTLTDGASIAWDMSQGSIYQVTLGGNRTLSAPTNTVPGKTYLLKVLQDSTGNRTLAYNAVYHAAGGAITITATANHWDWLVVRCITSTLFIVQQIADVSDLA
jgi:hypothetical protein